MAALPLLALPLLLVALPAEEQQSGRWTPPPPPSCASVTEDVPAGPVYVLPLIPGGGGVTVEVWTESNGVPGLQRSTCTDQWGAAHGPDTRETWVTAGCVYINPGEVCFV